MRARIQCLEQKIAFTSTRDLATIFPLQNAAEIYLMNPDGTGGQRVTDNLVGDAFPALRADGKRIVFDDLFVLNVDDVLNNVSLPRNITESPFDIEEDANWSPDGQAIVYTGHPASDQPPAPVFHYTSKEI